MTRTMLAAFVRAPFQFELREIPVPTVREGWALIKVEACGICGTDLHIAGSTTHRLTTKPPTEWQGFGHEIAGVVAEVGPGIHHVKEGDRVVLESGSFCGTCELCRNGRVDLCNKGPNFWSNESMGFAEYILAPKECLVPFDGLPFEVACLAEPLGVALDMTCIKKASRPRQRVGSGPQEQAMVNLRENQARGSLTQAVLVVGGMRAALDLADAGLTMTGRIRQLGPNPLKSYRPTLPARG